nr:hypothetical protein [Cressdnaviricota sp.]
MPLYSTKKYSAKKCRTPKKTVRKTGAKAVGPKPQMRAYTPQVVFIQPPVSPTTELERLRDLIQRRSILTSKDRASLRTVFSTLAPESVSQISSPAPTATNAPVSQLSLLISKLDSLSHQLSSSPSLAPSTQSVSSSCTTERVMLPQAQLQPSQISSRMLPQQTADGSRR